MAIQKRFKHPVARVTWDQAYFRIQPDSIRGGKDGWSCVLDVFQSAADAAVTQVRRPLAEVQKSGLSAEQITALEALQPMDNKINDPVAQVSVGGGGIGSDRSIDKKAPYVAGQDPFDTIYAFLMTHKFFEGATQVE